MYIAVFLDAMTLVSSSPTPPNALVVYCAPPGKSTAIQSTSPRERRVGSVVFPRILTPVYHKPPFRIFLLCSQIVVIHKAQFTSYMRYQALMISLSKATVVVAQFFDRLRRVEHSCMSKYNHITGETLLPCSEFLSGFWQRLRPFPWSLWDTGRLHVIAIYMRVPSVGTFINHLNVPSKHLWCHTAPPGHTQASIQLLQNRDAWKSAAWHINV